MKKEEIKKELRTLRIIFTINAILRYLNLVTIIICGVLELCEIFENSIIHNDFYLLIAVAGVKSIVLTVITRKLQVREIALNSDTASEALKDALIGGSIIPGTFVLLCIGLCLQSTEYAYILGFTSLGSISYIIGLLMALVLYDNIRYDDKTSKYGWQEEYKKTKRLEAEKQKKLKQKKLADLEKQKQYNNALNLLKEIGAKFFVKYYDKLEQWLTLDVFDSIEENYSEANKLARINAAKKVFELKLNTVALEIISKGTDITTDSETCAAAAELLQFTTKNTDEQTKSTDG